MTKGQYSPVGPEQARLVSCLLYGTLFLIVKCTSAGLHLKILVFFTHLWNFRKISIFLWLLLVVSTWRMTIFTLFLPFSLQILNLPASLQNKNTRIGPVPWKLSILKNPNRERTSQSTGICLRLGLPYNNVGYLILNLAKIKMSSFNANTQKFREILVILRFILEIKLFLMWWKCISEMQYKPNITYVLLFIIWCLKSGNVAFKGHWNNVNKELKQSHRV